MFVRLILLITVPDFSFFRYPTRVFAFEPVAFDKLMTISLLKFASHKPNMVSCNKIFSAAVAINAEVAVFELIENLTGQTHSATGFVDLTFN